MIRIVLLLSMVAAAFANGGLNAVASARKEANAEGGYDIHLSAQRCIGTITNYVWEVYKDRKYIRIAGIPSFTYKVSGESDTYEFRLTVWHKKNKSNKDSDIVKVKIGGGAVEKPDDEKKSRRVSAVAQIEDVKLSGDKYRIDLSGAESEYCDEPNWFVQKRSGRWKKIGTTMRVSFQTFRHELLAFRLKCSDSLTSRTDMAAVKTYLTECEDNIEEEDEPIRSPPGTPCNKMNVKAVPSVRKVVKTGEGHFNIHLTSKGSSNCDSYEWERNTANGYEHIGSTPKTIFHTKFSGKYGFRLICKNAECGDDEKPFKTECLNIIHRKQN